MKENEFEFNKNIFAERLLEKMDGISILKFSKEIGIPERTINGWVRKKVTPRMEYLIMLAKKFDYSIDYLVGLEDEFGSKIK